MKKIIIRADGSHKIGLGHVMRMLVLAEELKKYFHVEFICRNDENGSYNAGINIIKNNGFKVIEIPELRFEDEIVKVQKDEKSELLITDSYDVNEDYFYTMNKYFPKTMYLDDINVCNLDVDLILNQNINALHYNYNSSVNKKRTLLLGTKYVLLRKEFRKKIDSYGMKNVDNIMVTLGGTDENEISLKILESLKKFSGKIHVVIGNAFKENVKKEIFALANLNDNIIPYENACMSDVMSKCDLAISACGTTIYELCAMNVPTIAIVIASNQYEIAKYMGEKNLIVNTDRLINTDQRRFSDIVNEVIENKGLRVKLVQSANKIINKNGVEEVCKEIIKLIE